MTSTGEITSLRAVLGDVQTALESNERLRQAHTLEQVNLVMQRVSRMKKGREITLFLSVAVLAGVVAWVSSLNLGPTLQIVLAVLVGGLTFVGLGKFLANLIEPKLEKWAEDRLIEELRNIGLYSAHMRFVFDWKMVKASYREPI